MKNKKWKLTQELIWILVAIAIGFFIRGWSDPLLWAGWFTALGAAVGIFTGGNYLEKREYIKKGVDKELEN